MTKHITHKVIGAKEARGLLRVELRIVGPEGHWVRHCWVTVPADILPLRTLEALAYHAEMRENRAPEESTYRLF